MVSRDSILSKTAETVQLCRLRMGICVILVVYLSVYTSLFNSGIEVKDIDCSIWVVIVHTMFVTGE